MKKPPLSTSPIPASSLSGADVAAIFNDAFDFFGTLEVNGKVSRLSGRIFEQTKIDPQTLAGQKFHETVFWQTGIDSAEALRAAITKAGTGQEVQLNLPFRLNSDENVWIDISLRPLLDNSRKHGVFIAGRRQYAATNSSALEEEKWPEFLAAAENADIGLWIWDFADDKIYCTPRCNELLNIAPGAQLTSAAFLDAVHADDRAAVEAFLTRDCESGSKYREEFRVVFGDDSIEWISADGICISGADRKTQRLTGILRNVTERKSAAIEVAQVYERETKARDEAVDANRAKDFFLAFVSHELRSPLNAILGWSKILLTKQVDDETRTNALQTIEKSARFQTKLINDLVDSARVASGKLRLEYHAVNLYEIVNAAFQAQTPAAAAHSIEFNFVSESDNIPIFGDASRLQQVFGNLLSNAVKFTPDGGSVSLELRTEGGNAIVTVSDTGQGIEKEALPNIFRQFSQGDISQARTNYGLGLGLSIVNILVAKHGGIVVAESAGLNLGSKFTVTIPLSFTKGGEPEDTKQAASLGNRPLAGIRILVVEDDIDSREVLHLFLEQSGAAVQSTDSAKSALEVLSSQADARPDVIVSDLAMPDEDGYILMAKIRRLSAIEGGEIPALALSAFATSESKKRALEAGFSKYETKPFEPDLLISDILEIVGNKAGAGA
ncbi:MAG: ATP-binding protein [Pyrinomonadaceae bacterium]